MVLRPVLLRCAGVQVLKIRGDAHIYFTNDGRISMAGVTTGNVEYIAESIFAITG